MIKDMYGLSSGNNLIQLKKLGLNSLDIDRYDELPKGTDILIYDEDGTYEQRVLKTLVDKGSRLYYVYNEGGEYNSKYLVNMGVFNIYNSVDINELTADLILTIMLSQKTAQDTKEVTGAVREINSLNSCLTMVDSFLNDINNKNKEGIIRGFESNLPHMLELKNLMTEKLNETESIRRELIKTRQQVELEHKRYDQLLDKHDNLILSGRKCEDDNKALSDKVIGLTMNLAEREKQLLECKEGITSSVSTITNLNNRVMELEQQLKESQVLAHTTKAKYEGVLKQLDTMSATLSSADIKTDNITINLTMTGKVEKFIYIKVIDMLPYLIHSLKSYPKYLEGKIKKHGCAMLIIAGQGSTVYDQYSKIYTPVTKDTKYVDCDKKIYVVEGFNTLAETFIQECNCQLAIIVDLTLKNATLINSVRMKKIYAVNSIETIEACSLNPKDCISYSDLHKCGVVGHIPKLTQEEVEQRGKGLLKLKDSLYAFLDTYWW